MVYLFGVFEVQNPPPMASTPASSPSPPHQPPAPRCRRGCSPLPQSCTAQPREPTGRAFAPRSSAPLLDACLCFRDGTPGSQIVTERFEVTWESVMVSSHNAIVLKFDGRGSGFQGTKLLHEVKRRLGLLEEKDQLEAVR